MSRSFSKYFALFEHDLQSAMRASWDERYRERLAQNLKWEADEIRVYAIQCSRLMQKRKQFLYTVRRSSFC